MTSPEELDAILAKAPDQAEADTRQALLNWVARQCIWARIDEINKFAIAGLEESLHEDTQITAYFVGRLSMLAEEMEEYDRDY